MKSKSKSFFYARFFSQLPFSSTHVDGGEDDTVFEEAQVLFEKIMGSSIDIILSKWNIICSVWGILGNGCYFDIIMERRIDNIRSRVTFLLLQL